MKIVQELKADETPATVETNFFIECHTNLQNSYNSVFLT